MKKDYIVLNGSAATYTNSRLQWNGLLHNHFQDFAQDGHDDIYLSLSSVNFMVEGTADTIAQSVIVDTNLKFGNMTTTASSSSVLGVVGCSITQDSLADYYITPTNQLNAVALKTSKFNSIQIGIVHQNEYLDLSALKSWLTIVLEVEYRKNDTQELKI